MVATSVTVTTIIRYQPASQASLISNLAHNDPGKVVITPSMQLSRGEPLYLDHNDPGKVVCQVSTVERQWWAWQCKWSVLGLLLSTGDHEVYDDSHYMQVFFLLFLSIFKTKGEIVVQPARAFPLSNRRERKCLRYSWWSIQIIRLPRWVSSKTHNVTKWVTGCDSGPRGLGRISGPQTCPVGTQVKYTVIFISHNHHHQHQHHVAHMRIWKHTKIANNICNQVINLQCATSRTSSFYSYNILLVI